MTDPITFQSTSARHALPLLFAAQAQKEVVLNESLLRLDMLLHCAAESVASTPPQAPQEGQCWIVGSPASGLWAGKEGAIAAYTGGDWLYLTPPAGMQCWLKAAGQWLRYDNGWHAPAAPAAPSGGSVVDSESRAALAAIINALTEAGIFPR